MGLKKSELDTPCLILDLDFLEQNLVSMQKNASSAGKNLRPLSQMWKNLYPQLGRQVGILTF